MNWAGGRTVPISLAAATLVPIGALGLLGVLIFQQDRAIERQRRAEGLKLAGGRLALAVEQKLATVEEQLGKGGGIRFTEDGLGPGVLYQPQEPPVGRVTASRFAEGEALEYQKGHLGAAANEYARIAETKDPTIRAEVLYDPFYGGEVPSEQTSWGSVKAKHR